MKLLKILISFLFSLGLAGCLENGAETQFNTSLENTAIMLRYTEKSGDFANTEEAPGLVSANELYANLNEFAVIDIRPASEFKKGRIQNAVSTTSLQLYSLADSLRKNGTSGKIVIVDENGQSSAYYTCLLHLAGFKNIFSLNFGMASWNRDFAGQWLKACTTSEYINSFTKKDYPKNPALPLPGIEFPHDGTNSDAKCLARIKEKISAGFNENSEYVTDLIGDPVEETYFICCGSRDLYGEGHYPGTVLYYPTPIHDLRSVNYLQTLPPSGKIIIYSTNGQLSSCMAAYLSVLGYNTKALLFGAHSLLYLNLTINKYLEGEVFTEDKINYFPYEK